MHSLSQPLLAEYKQDEPDREHVHYSIMFHLFVILAIITIMLNMTLFNLDYVQIYVYVTWPLFTLVSFVSFHHAFVKYDIAQEIVTVMMITTISIWFIENSTSYLSVELLMIVCSFVGYSSFELTKNMKHARLYFGLLHWSVLVLCVNPSFFFGDDFFRSN